VSAPPLLELDDVAVRFPVRRGLLAALARRRRRCVEAVGGVSLTLAPGEMLALVGESGSGKTTTGHVALRLLDATSGTVRFGGEDVTHRTGRALRVLRRELQIVYQDPYEALDPRFAVRAIVEQPLRIHSPHASREERRRRVHEALELVGLAPATFLERRPYELSGGQRQRVAIAASLVLEPRMLLADEPVSMLDVSIRAEVMSLLGALRDRGIAILLVTHDLATAVNYADRIAVMYLGRIVESGPPGTVVDAPRHPYTRALLSVVPSLDPRERRQLAAPKGEIPDATRIPSGCRFHPRCPVAFEDCPRRDPELAVTLDDPAHRVACLLDPACVGRPLDTPEQA